MSLWQEIIASLAVIGLGIWFVSWCLADALTDMRYWEDDDRH